ncbi:polyprenyl synthetase family protein [Bacteriovorax sp. Seq25_V]|uniref:polyprenyl synthetase family protein n=1 Tax=Bacteriovorax sp. Seq25_V TaxID=1201288 RepID=UPI000389EE36|nr:polyprenyl synthetase family protein [Bacteriovorax sp. Seq25_V]EQC44224.1 polyprenyl synthetase [Bacteriovorax sp. Seq25_V]
MASFFESVPQSVLDKIDSLELKVEGTNCLQAISSLLEKTVLSGGKRLRPMLTFMMGELFFLESEGVVECAKAIEMVHGASLAHDDVVDNATQRRGEPSINIVASNKSAVLAGDYLLADVIHRLAHLGDIEVIRQMSDVIKELALGEWIQSDAIEERSYSRELIEKIAQHKTASVMSFCTWAPAHISKAPAEIVASAHEFGRRLGLAFQLMDDTLDYSDNSQKDVLLDVKNNIVNSVVLEWLELNPEAFAKYREGTDLIDLWNESHLEAAVETVKSRALSHMDVARDCLSKIAAYHESQGQSKEVIDQRLAPLNFIIDFIITRDI